MTFLCWLFGHKFHSMIPAIKPVRWTHSLFCTRCGFTMTFANHPDIEVQK